MSTRYETEHQCPNGTFNNMTGLQSKDQCLNCTPGHYCPSSGLSEPAGECDAGWFCKVGSVTKQPSDLMEGGNICPVRHFCPKGSSIPRPCSLGKYCNIENLGEPQGDCDAGWFCNGSSLSNQPENNDGGYECPPGHFCERGTTAPTPCPEGYYLPFTGAPNKNSCQPCQRGYYCNGTGLANVSSECIKGYYCPAQSILPKSTCPEGYKCPQGSEGPVLCDPGQYQNKRAQSDCKTCPPGFYCDPGVSGPVTNYTSFPCPKGHYCLEGTRSMYEYKCPPGFFNNETGLQNVNECTECLPRFYCPSYGQERGDIYPCPAGYYCLRNANSSMPTNEPAAGICPKGHYCPELTDNPRECPLGTFNNETRITNITLCQPCTAGYYCNETGLIKPKHICDEGFYCPSHSVSSTQVDCPAGNYCPPKSQIPVPCPEGTYSNSTNNKKSEDCLKCLEGFFCPDSGLIKPKESCRSGYYCPLGTVQPSLRCTAGFHCPEGSSIPIPCKDGFYTSSGQQDFCELCPARFYCKPVNESLALVGGDGMFDCPRGHYCPNGTGLDWPVCPKGTFNPNTGLSKKSECLKCPGGMYCDQVGLTTPTGPCAAGHYCEIGNDRKNPSSINCNTSTVGGLCWEGYECPEGSANMSVCPPGTYQNQRGMSSCLPCPEGYYCVAKTKSLEGLECPPGYFCPLNTTRSDQHACPAGTYNPEKGQKKIDDCLQCPGGGYCREGAGNVTGDITAGFFCRGGCKGPEFSTNDSVEICPIGSYCSSGKSYSI